MKKVLLVMSFVMFCLLAGCDNQAQEEFTVTFDGGGGTLVSGEEIQTIIKGESAESPIYEREDYWLSGWSRDYSYVLEDITVTALWEEIEKVSTIDYIFTGSGYKVVGYQGNVKDLVVPNKYNDNENGLHSVVAIGERAFSNTSDLENITLPNTITIIEESAFYGNQSLINISIPNSVTSIGESAFSFCKLLESIVLPDSVLDVGDDAFSYCESLSQVTLSSNMTSIGDHTFSHCSSLTSIVIPDNIVSVGEFVFDNCSSLTNITMSENVTDIINFMFAGCTALTTISIPSSVSEIGYLAFSNCSSLESIKVAIENINYKDIDGVLYDKEVTEIINYPAAKADLEFEIPSTVVKIINYSFSGNQYLTNVLIPNTTTEILYNAFKGCSALISVDIPASVTSIDYSSFEDCISLININVDNDNTIYESLNGVLYDKGIRSLILYPIGKSSVNFTIPNTVDKICNFAFWGCTNLENVVIPSSVVNIDISAFYGCTSLTNVIIPSSVIYIDVSAFEGCTSLTISSPQAEKPAGWHNGWNPDNRPVVWNYVAE